jgi:hypothetical protein
MSRFLTSLTAVSSTQLGIAQAPEIGADTDQVLFAPFLPVLLGHIVTGTTNTWTPVANAVIPSDYKLVGRVAKAPLLGANYSPAASVVVEMSLSVTGSAASAHTATFVVPSYTTDQRNVWREFVIRDLIPTTGADESKQVLSVTSLTSVTGAAIGCTIEIWAMPPREAYTYIECVSTKSGGVPVDKIIPIPCGRDPQRHTKRGRRDLASLSITYPYKGALDQLAKFNGLKGTLCIITTKDGVTPTEISFFSGYIPAATPDRGDGDDIVTATSEGTYENYFVGYAS